MCIIDSMDLIDMLVIAMEALSIIAIAYYIYNQHTLVLTKRKQINTDKYLALHLQIELTKLSTLQQYNIDHKVPEIEAKTKVHQQIVNIVAIVNVILAKCKSPQINPQTLIMLRNNMLNTINEQ